MTKKQQNILNSYETNNWFMRILHRLSFCWAVLTNRYYYLVSFKTDKDKNVNDIVVKTYSVDNRGVKELSLYLYNQLQGMDAVTDQVNDILSTGKKNIVKKVIQVTSPDSSFPFFILKDSENKLKTVYKISEATNWANEAPDKVLAALAITKDKFLNSQVELKDIRTYPF